MVPPPRKTDSVYRSQTQVSFPLKTRYPSPGHLPTREENMQQPQDLGTHAQSSFPPNSSGHNTNTQPQENWENELH